MGTKKLAGPSSPVFLWANLMAKTAKKMGRPGLYSTEITETFCEHIADGMALKDISKMPGMPKESTVHQWLNKHPEFAELYARARLRRADKFADELIEIADTEDDAARARNRIDVRKWSAAKLNPKVYGDRTTISGTGDKDDTIHIDSSAGLDLIFSRLAKLAARDDG